MERIESLSAKESVNFLNFARRSCGEVRSQLYAGLDAGYISEEAFTDMHKQAVKTGKILTGFMAYSKSRSN